MDPDTVFRNQGLIAALANAGGWKRRALVPVEEEEVYAYEVESQPVAPAPAYVAREPAPRVAREETYDDRYAMESAAPRPQRMPTMEEFPRPGQEQLRQARGETNSSEARRRSLFEKLVAFGASRQEEVYEPTQAQPAAPRAPRSQAPQPSPTHAEYAKRVSAQANAAAMRADLQARRPAPARNVEEDHLEIPAFLRRQAHR